MSRITPAMFAEFERNSHHRSTAILVATTAVLVAALVMLGDMPLHQTNAKQQEEPKVETLESPSVAEPDTAIDAIKAERGIWMNRVETIGGKIPDAESRSALLEDLERLGRQLGAVSVQRDSVEHRSLLESLDSIERRVLSLRKPAEGTDANFDARLKDARRILEETAVKAAIISVQEEFEDELRTARLDLRELQDQAATLAQQIASAEREQMQILARQKRAQALDPHMADIRKYLSAFTSPGYLQPISDRNPWHTKRTVDATPVSLSALKRLGALEHTMEGLERLYQFGGGRNPVHNNKRTPGLFPTYSAYYINKPEVKAIVERAQQLLRDHGEALVEAKLLLP